MEDHCHEPCKTDDGAKTRLNAATSHQPIQQQQTVPSKKNKQVGILHSLWHTRAALSMERVKQMYPHHPQLTVERVIRSNGKYTLDDVYPNGTELRSSSIIGTTTTHEFFPPFASYDGMLSLSKEETDSIGGDSNITSTNSTTKRSQSIYNVEPAELGFYCLFKKAAKPSSSSSSSSDIDEKTNEKPYFRHSEIADCKDTERIAERHAKLLTDAGFDYIVLGITNWPQVNEVSDVAILRPFEVLIDHWIDLRANGIATPQIVPWIVAHVSSYSDGHMTMWNWFLQYAYNNSTRSSLLWKKNNNEKFAFFVRDDDKWYNETVNKMIASNGGRDNIEVIPMWAFQSEQRYRSGSWGFFSPCQTVSTKDGKLHMTTSIVGEGDCNQRATLDPKTKEITEISASGAYMLAQCSLPWASPGKLRYVQPQKRYKEKALCLGAEKSCSFLLNFCVCIHLYNHFNMHFVFFFRFVHFRQFPAG